ncbi:MAG: TRAP transporter small permease subunit [Alphaproteobacteria bacterium]|nr:TRAP transporter small permease subunit [Alphaproteobacteria bacterium]
MMDERGSHPMPPAGHDRLAAIERLVMVALFLALTVVGCLQIVNRHGLNLPIWNLEQLLPHIFIGMTFLGMPLMYRRRALLAVEIVPDSLPGRVRRPYRLVLWLVTAAFLGMLVYTSLDVLAFQLEINAVTNMGYPAAILTITLPVGAILSLWRIWQVEIRPLLGRKP